MDRRFAVRRQVHAAVASRDVAGMRWDAAVIGGGIVGLAVARQLLLSRPGMCVIVLEKEARVGQHQTGHNSGVIHAGVYYSPGSLRAQLCVRGAAMMFDYCEARKVPYHRIGKLIVATTEDEIPRLKALFERGQQNGVRGLGLLDRAALRAIEPHCTGGIMAIHSPNTGMTNFGQVARALADDITSLGGVVRTGARVVGADRDGDGVALRIADAAAVRADRVIACAGLFSDRVARLLGGASSPSIVPVRGEYFILSPEAALRVRGLIYPVPDPSLPFLGVHLSHRIDGSVLAGPTALPCFSREGYSRATASLADMADMIGDPGARRLAARHWRFAARQLARAAWLPLQIAQLRRFVPTMSVSDVARGTAGVRAQAVDENGALIDDFVMERIGPVLNVRNAPSPAATASLAIAQLVVERALAKEG